MHDPVSVGCAAFFFVGVGGSFVGFLTPMLHPFDVFMPLGIAAGIAAYLWARLHGGSGNS